MVILTDTDDRPIGRSPKLDAHREGLLHRAFSVFIFNGAGEMLLQQRAMDKYHSPGLWANTCCSHPLPGEDTPASAARRLEYEMGIKAELEFRDSLIYRSDVGNGLTEHEYDHIFTGVSDSLPRPNPQEVMDYKYISPEEILGDMDTNAEQYCVWFRIIFSKYYRQIKVWAK